MSLPRLTADTCDQAEELWLCISAPKSTAGVRHVRSDVDFSCDHAPTASTVLHAILVDNCWLEAECWLLLGSVGLEEDLENLRWLVPVEEDAESRRRLTGKAVTPRSGSASIRAV